MTKRRSPPSGVPPVGSPEYRGAIRAKDYGEAQRVTIVSDAFLEHLIGDPRVAALFERWGNQTRLYEATGDELLARLEAGEWSDQLEPKPWPFVRDELELSSPVEHGGDAWLWLALALREQFLCKVMSHIVPGVNVTRSPSEAVVIPPITEILGEVYRAVARGDLPRDSPVVALLDEQWRRRHPETRTEAPAVGRAPRDDAYLRTWAVWFYRARVKRPPDTISSLAREAWPELVSDGLPASALPRNEIRRDIREAERLLSLIRV